jgi:CelD/BcsL family acetyltransferase involved in cellulose biosynthesis
MRAWRQAEWNSAGAAELVAPAEEGPLFIKMERAAGNVYEIDPLNDARWDALVESHPGTSVFHSTKWLRALQTTYGYDTIAVTTCPRGVPLTNGLVFCRVKSWFTGRRFVSLPFSDHCEPLVNNAEELEELLLCMRQQVDNEKWKYLELRPISRQPSGFTGLNRSVTYHLHRLDLRRSTDELFHGFHKDCVQRKIRRAERENLRYEEGTSEDLLQKFYQLLVMTRRRKSLPPQPLTWFRSLIKTFGKDLKIRVASKGSLPVASILTLSHKKSMVYKYGCSDAASNRLGGMALLFWRTIQEAKDRELEQLDMGRSEIDNPGLTTFKEHWGAAGTVMNYWTYPHRPVRRLSGWEKKLVGQVVSAAPASALEAIGTLLYRHIG